MDSAIEVADIIMAGRHSEESYKNFRDHLKGLTNEAFLSQASFIIERYEDRLWDRDYLNIGSVMEKVAMENSSKAGKEILKKLVLSRSCIDDASEEPTPPHYFSPFDDHM